MGNAAFSVTAAVKAAARTAVNALRCEKAAAEYIVAVKNTVHISADRVGNSLVNI